MQKIINQNSQISKSENKKFTEIEIVRTLAFIAVFNQHVLGAAARRNNGLLPINIEMLISFIFELSRFAVPAFVFMFGLLMVMTYKEHLPYPEYLWKRIKQIYLPYVFASLIYIAFDVYRYHEEIELANFFKTSLVKIVFGNAFYHLWYVPMIFQFVILAPLFFYILRWIRSGAIGYKLSIVIYAVFALLSLAYLFYIPVLNLPTFFKGNYVKFFATWLFFFGTGALCGLNYEKTKYYIKKFFPVTAVVAIGAIAFAFYKDLLFIQINHTVHFSQVSFLQPAYAVLTIIEIFALIAIADYLKNIDIISRVSLLIGVNSYMAYLVHALVIALTSILIAKILPGLDLKAFYLILYPFSLIITVMASTMINRAMKGLKYKR